MDLFQTRHLRSLLESPGDPAISVFMPTHRAGPETRQDPVRFKNLLGRAEEALIERGLRRTEAEALLAPARALERDPDFWQHQADGLAVFVAPGFRSLYRVPIDLDELVVVAGRFHVSPVLPLLTGDGRFFVLALSQNEIRLLEGSRQTVSEIELEDVPQSLKETLFDRGPRKQLQFHTETAGGGGGRRPAVFHGHGPGGAEEKELIRKHFRAVDEGVREVLSGERAPMVLAGVDYLLPMYREVTDYPAVLEEGVTGNPEGLRLEELHDRAWALVEPRFHQDQERAVALFGELAGTGRTATGIHEVLRAAATGRVDTLFAPIGVHRWGSYDREADRLEEREDNGPGTEDLLDLAVVHTLTHAGRVYAVEAGDVPGSDDAAAVLRY